jgi:glycosyltransferase involved in cell wall biosynthesis
MRALQRIQQADPRCHALIVGADDVSYGKRPPSKDKGTSAGTGTGTSTSTSKGKSDATSTWRERMLAEVPLDPTRTHFLGRIPRAHYLRVLQVSAAHVYLTYPFVLSWSLLEAMACGAPIVASNTAPVREVIRHGHHGQLVDFFDVAAIADAAVSMMGNQNDPAVTAMRQQARADAKTFSTDAGVTGYDGLVGAVQDLNLLATAEMLAALTRHRCDAAACAATGWNQSRKCEWDP